MKKLIWDIETSDLELKIRTYQLKNYIKYFDPKTIERDWTMLGVAWKWLGEKKTNVISVKPDDPLNDYDIVCHMHAVLQEADILIGHNADNFDLKKFNTRAIAHGLDPLPQKQSIDTLKVARKYFKFTSNKLSYLADFLGVSLKDESPDWKKIIEGCPKELRYMRKYNKQDVVATEAVYLKLMGWHHTHPKNEAVRDSGGKVVSLCPKCSSPDHQRRGYQYLASGRKRQRFSCNSCHGYWSGDMI